MNSKLITLFISIAATIILFAGCGGGGGGGSSNGGNGGGTGTTSGYTGRVVRQDTLNGLANVKVEIRDAGGSVLKVATTNSTGNFSVDLTGLGTPTRFHIINSSIPIGYFKQFSYNTKRYTTLDTTCSAPLPTYNPGFMTPMATSIVITPQNLPPPPPPNGCGL
ncbi:MAG: hypothetical protein KF784_01395 [Fimbriimonadaceae bacterium]|nr:hypothetical protein [Fimbriimonadaceae bacterium]